MKIKKVLNHNSVLVTDGEGQESILMGKGIAFGYKKGDSVNTQLIDKQFGLISAGSGRNAFRSEFLEAFNGLEDDELEATLKIIAFAKTQISDIDDTIYLTLADHVHGIKLRVRKGAVNVRNPLKNDIKKLYPEEYAIGVKALEFIDETLCVQMEDDEAATIAIHFANACFFKDMTKIYGYIEIIRDIIALTEQRYRIHFNEDSISFFRFQSHLKYLAQKIISGDNRTNHHINMALADAIKNTMRDYYEGACEIKRLLLDKYQYELNEMDVLYLSINLQQIMLDGVIGKK